MKFLSPQAQQDWLAAKSIATDPHLFGCAETWAAALESRSPDASIGSVAIATISNLLIDPTPARVHTVAGMLHRTWQHGEELHEWCSSHLLLA